MAVAWACRVTKLASTITRRSSTQQPNTGQYVRRWTAEYLIPHLRCYATYSGRDIKTGVYDYDLAVRTAIEEYTKQEQIVKEDGMVYYPLKGTSGGLNMNMVADDDDDGMEYPLKAMVRQRINLGLKIREDRLLYPLVYPLIGRRKCFGDLKMFLIVLKTILGEKYASICLAPDLNDESVESEAMKLVLFRKLDSKVPFFFDRAVSDMNRRMSRSDPRVVAAALFSLARQEEKDKLVRVIKAKCQMISEYQVLRMRFQGESRQYEAIVLVPSADPKNMELVLFRNDGCSKFNKWMFRSTRRNMAHNNRHYKYDDGSGECYASIDDSVFALSIMHTNFGVWRKDYLYGYVECWHKDTKDHHHHQCVADGSHSEDEDDEPTVGSNECSTDDPDVMAAARYALSLNKGKEKIRRVFKAFSIDTIPTNRTLRIIFEGESRWYDAIVLVHGDITKPEENMTVVQMGQADDCCSPNELGCAPFMLDWLHGYKYHLPPFDNDTKVERSIEAVKSWPQRSAIEERERWRNQRRPT